MQFRNQAIRQPLYAVITLLLTVAGSALAYGVGYGEDCHRP